MGIGKHWNQSQHQNTQKLTKDHENANDFSPSFTGLIDPIGQRDCIPTVIQGFSYTQNVQNIPGSCVLIFCSYKLPLPQSVTFGYLNYIDIFAEVWKSPN